jgi:hypothetical protein
MAVKYLGRGLHILALEPPFFGMGVNTGTMFFVMNREGCEYLTICISSSPGTPYTPGQRYSIETKLIEPCEGKLVFENEWESTPIFRN